MALLDPTGAGTPQYQDRDTLARMEIARESFYAYDDGDADALKLRRNRVQQRLLMGATTTGLAAAGL